MSNTNTQISNLMVVGEVSKTASSYSTHFTENFNVDGSPDSVTLEDIFNAPQDNIDDIVGYSKYCYRKYGIIMRVINITRDFGASGLSLQFPKKNEKIKKIIDDYNKKINIDQFVRDCLFELALTGNLTCYDRGGSRVDIYPVNQIEVLPLIENNKQIVAYKIDSEMSSSMEDYGTEINEKILNAYPEEIKVAIKENKEIAVLDSKNAYFAKINSSQYEPYGISIILPAFEDLAHKSLLKEAEKATLNDIIEKIMLVKVGDEDNKPNANLIRQYTDLLNNISGSVRMTVPHYVSIEYVEPETGIFENNKYLEVDTDILNTLGISLSLIRGESGGNYSEGIINFSGLVRTIESIRNPLIEIIEGLYKSELTRNGMKEEDCPSVTFNDVVIDKTAQLDLVNKLFESAGLPHATLYEAHGYDFESILSLREAENESGVSEIMSLHSNPFSANNDSNEVVDEGGAPTKNISERKSGVTQSNNDAPRSGMKTPK